MSIFATTTQSVEGYRVKEYRGIVRGIVVRTPTIGQGFLGGLQSMVGGQIAAFTEMCEQTRQQAYEQMVQHALQLGANAVINVRYDASDVIDKATEVICYGTAVVIEPG